MRVFFGGLATETNTFAPFPTALSAFEEYKIRRDTSIAGNSPLAGPLRVFRSRAEADGCEVIETIAGFAQPGGATVRAAYEQLRDTILTDLRAAGAVDMILLMLHAKRTPHRHGCRPVGDFQRPATAVAARRDRCAQAAGDRGAKQIVFLDRSAALHAGHDAGRRSRAAPSRLVVQFRTWPSRLHARADNWPGSR